MRVFGSMLRWLSAGIFALVLVLVIAFPVRAAEDTGTYRISNYVVTLAPQSSGKVRMTYEQEWRVLSGHIPWVTVGLANSNFTITSHSEAAARVSSVNSGGFTGVRIDLDKDYQPGETFKVQFVVLQGNLLERLTGEKKWRINFTPGWYDRAIIEHLEINLSAPVSTEAYSLLSPQPVSTGDTITWEKSSLKRGERFNIRAECLDGTFLSPTVPVATSPRSQSSKTWPIVPIIIGIIIFTYLSVVLFLRNRRQSQENEIKARITAMEKELATDEKKAKKAKKGFEDYVEFREIEPDAKGRYYDRSYGDYITPAIWMAVLSKPNRPIRSRPIASSSSCACACVSCACACACACAGGGAAGCSRKTLHECQVCSSLAASTPPKMITDDHLVNQD